MFMSEDEEPRLFYSNREYEKHGTRAYVSGVVCGILLVGIGITTWFLLAT